MLLVVVDTNIYVSALVFDGTPALALQLPAAGIFQLVVSETIQAEVEETLTRKFGWDAEHFAAIAAELWRDARHVTPAQPVKASRDPDDDHILACALEAHAQVILTGDGDLLSLHPYGEISILTPKQFLEAKPWQR
ncbi:MAG TPA: putative toxin-antitoxin system toxin component, PIN family [Bryobacteraceae bacterium]|nr:putative toxin-antitoxin system toxin component, PIN family [Bryobacteraceae bacterium]